MAQIQRKLHFQISLIKTFRMMYDFLGLAEVQFLTLCFCNDVMMTYRLLLSFQIRTFFRIII